MIKNGENYSEESLKKNKENHNIFFRIQEAPFHKDSKLIRLMFWYYNIFTFSIVFSLAINYFDDNKVLSQIFYAIFYVQQKNEKIEEYNQFLNT